MDSEPLWLAEAGSLMTLSDDHAEAQDMASVGYVDDPNTGDVSGDEDGSLVQYGTGDGTGDGELMPPPIQSQPSGYLAMEPSVKEEMKEVLATKHRDLNSLNFALKKELEKREKLPQVDPFAIAQEKHKEITELAKHNSEDEAKANALLFNTINMIFQSARKSKALRKYAAQIFGELDQYADAKEELAKINLKLELLTELYNEMELKQVYAHTHTHTHTYKPLTLALALALTFALTRALTLALTRAPQELDKLAKKREARMAALATKAAAKVKATAEKEAAKEAAAASGAPARKKAAK